MKHKNFKNIKKQAMLTLRVSSVLAIAAVMIGGVFFYVPQVRADRFQDQINELNAQNGQKDQEKDGLKIQAGSLQGEINRLQGEINSIQAKINSNTAEINRLNIEIQKAEEELVKQRDLLGQTIRAMYVEGEISTIEMLATSKDLSDFFDKQQYRESVNSKIKTTLDKITQLKLELKSQKEIVEKLLGEQKALQGSLAGQRSESNRLLSLNQSEQNQINAEIQANSSKIADLRRQQIAANARFSGSSSRSIPDTSGYPWANYRAGSWTHAGSCYYGDDVDPWGMCYRQCVSYVAWKVWRTKGYMPRGWGDAKNWDNRASAAGYTVNSTPAPGSVAVSNSGTWGHVMFVESVNGNGTINISQYNVRLTGEYSEATVSANGLSFIHF